MREAERERATYQKEGEDEDRKKLGVGMTVGVD